MTTGRPEDKYLAVIEALLASLLTGDRATALELARRALAHGGLEHVYEGLMKPALQRVGELWEEGHLTLADEHLATAVVQGTMAALYSAVRWPPRGAKAIVAAVPGEEHTLGARMIGDLLALDGWDDVFMACPESPEAVAARAKQDGAGLIALSVSLSAHVPALHATVEAIRRAVPEARIVAGGRALDAIEDAAGLGVDLLAREARRGVHEARRFKS